MGFFFSLESATVEAMIALNTPIEQVPKVQGRIVAPLKRLGIKTLRDLLLHFPHRYDDFSNEKHIRSVMPGETVTVAGEIQRVSNHRTAKKHMALVEVTLRDKTGTIKATWFNQPYLARVFAPGQGVRISGKAAIGPKGLYLQNPAYEKIQSFKPQVPNQNIHTGGLVPIYPETEGITSRWLRFLIKTYIGGRSEISDSLPPDTRNRHGLPAAPDALFFIHFPKTHEEAARAKRRFLFEKLLLLQMRALRERTKLKQHRSPAITLNLPLLKQFVGSLSFELTDAQRRAIWEIAQDISKSRPMNRLLEGDVGSGKTVVSAAAALLSAKSGFCAAFMAPTEILAHQHYETLKKLLAPFRISVSFLTGAAKKIKPGDAVVVGTHALIQKNVRFSNLGLVVVDEQHRFGVEQRAKLAGGGWRMDDGKNIQESVPYLPHFLSMSATPIPRTLALAVYGDLDLSMLAEMPKGRIRVSTKIVQPGERGRAYQFMRDEARRKKQIFVICPRIETPDIDADSRLLTPGSQQKIVWSEVKAVIKEYEKLSRDVFPDLRVAMLHGRMKPKEKEEIMGAFQAGRTDILVSTSVVEVGVDVPNATVIAIEGAERFGLAQLHQFRGRVGRGKDQAYCFLFPTENGMAARRLKALEESHDGFALAEKDLEVRGAGDMFGTRQWGISDLSPEIFSDTQLIREVQSEAALLAKKSPDLSLYPELRAALLELEHTKHME